MQIVLAKEKHRRPSATAGVVGGFAAANAA
jgi:hypothetical protein